MADYDILLINPPYLGKPDYAIAGTEGRYIVEKYINPGILSIASYLHAKGFSTKILDLISEKSLDSLARSLRSEKPAVVGISCTSGFDYLGALECAKVTKTESPSSLCIAGGQHIGALGKIALEDCKQIDLVVRYEGEWLCEKILNRVKKGRSLIGLPGIAVRKGERYHESPLLPPIIDLNDMPFFNFELYPNYIRYLPLIEESRGCPYACDFCASSFMYRGNIRVKKCERLVKEIDNAIGFYGHKSTYLFLASLFGFNSQNTIRLATELKKKEINWRTELRVDSTWEKYLPLLRDSGLCICNVGVESASPEILLRMNKTLDPVRYVEKASKLIQAVSQLKGLKLRIQIMMYIGETPETLLQTRQFLTKNAGKFDSLLASPVFVFPSTALALEFPRLQDTYKCELVQTKYTNQTHLYPCKLSEHFSFEKSAQLCDFMEKVFSSS